ncbi:hypothetical protein ACFXDF_39280 [Streptomyces sp. NPDC059426]|uniref:hypothetical protein n=1 Tax=Streptomyces sp. NPDC059426 TaxID=3346827 RepID=UPI00369BBF0E
MLQTLLALFPDGDGWDMPISSPGDEKNVTATKPVTETGWKRTADGRRIRWTNPSEDAGVDAFAT